ncbi:MULTISPECIES: hypothetical protein [Bifidobacterium]|uniref:hypothetical protein n=1 Tax=Bifidobacterium TaxID=1678 RepID=UPI001BDD6BDE|nr:MULTISPECIES: hypothetical protein [Bifidobacterium]MBT1161018.1 hypothetical protein [Bifidobacterium sp. SO1]MBW3079548.1 hypothetical protein [Bifidobacterium simiiventris]
MDSYYLYIVLISIAKGFGLQSNNIIYIGVFAIGCVLVFAKMIHETYTTRQLLCIALILGIGVADFAIGRSTAILLTGITIVGAKGVSFKKIAKIVLLVRSITFLIMVALSSANIIPNNNISFYRDNGFIDRYAFGFTHPNAAHMSLAIILVLAFYIYIKKINLIWVFIGETANYILYRYTGSRTGLLITAVCLLMFIVLKKIPRLVGSFRFLFRYSFWIMLFISIGTALLYPKVAFIQRVDSLLTGRVLYAYEILQYRIPLIGSIKYNEYVNFDNGYITLLYEGGLFAFLWIAIYISLLTRFLYNEKRTEDLLLIFIFNVYALTESFYPSAVVNISLILIAQIIFRKDRINGIGHHIYANV